MKNLPCLRQSVTLDPVKTHRQSARAKRTAALGVLLVACIAPLGTQGQKPKDETVNISSVSTRSSSSGTLVSIAADGALSHAQSWQDSEGYHVVVPYAAAQSSVKAGKGVKLRRIGQSLEILVQTKPGTSVTVQPGENRLNLSVSGKLESHASDGEEGTAAESNRTEETQNQAQRRTTGNVKATNETKPADGQTSSQLSSPANNWASLQQQPTLNSNQAPYQPSVPYAKSGPAANQLGSTQNSKQARGPDGDGDSQVLAQPEDQGFFASIFSSTGVLVVIALAILGFLVSRRVRSSQVALQAKHITGGDSEEDAESLESFEGGESPQSLERQGSQAKANGSSSSNGLMKIRKANSSLAVATPDSLYGAYRIDQEVGKLVIGQPHRMDVLASRAPDDRRAIETSLIKIITTSLDEAERRRACDALEEYGFVARQCASLLLASDAFERTSAARSLGEIRAASALPFLLEALYDHESIVRNQAVVSIGELKLPRAIGALLDMARQHPDVPGSLVSKALSACSVEGLDFFDAVMPEPALLEAGSVESPIHEITHLEPATSVESLPESSDDEGLAEALARMQSQYIAERAEAVKDLARFQVQTSVAALAFAARHDEESSIRAQAISSLASINHESVFPAVLIGMADESREVRASAARSLSRLSCDRADAYVRVIETTDPETLPDVARACIEAGIVAQGIDRLASSDRRQAYEAFSIVTLLAKACMFEPIRDAVCNHPSMEVRLTAVRLLSTIDQPEVFDQLRELAVVEGMPEEVRTALLETMYKLDQAKQTDEEILPAAESEVTSEFEMFEQQEDDSDVEREGESEVETHADEIEL
jgi:HEAT repeat protein